MVFLPFMPRIYYICTVLTTMKMKLTAKMLTVTLLLAAAAGCAKKGQEGEFRYLVDEFADLQILRYRIPGFEDLSLRQKQYVYWLNEAAKYGRDIIWDQNCERNLEVRHALEAIIKTHDPKDADPQWTDFMTYAKRVFFSNGIHHHYAENKMFPACDMAYFAALMQEAGCADEDLLDVIYNPERYPEHIYTGKGDIVAKSAANFYKGVTKDEVNAFYDKMMDPKDPCPISYGLNSKVVKGDDGVIREEVYKAGGLYGPAIEKICECLEKAAEYAENDLQKQYIATLVDYYRTGDLRTWDKYNVEWVGDLDCTVDFVNGFIEDYDDPLGRKASWEGIVNIRDNAASERTETLSANAQWFEDNAPMDVRFKKKECKGVSAKVINVTCIAGDDYPATAIGINLPNADWIRRDHGSKSVTIANITNAHSFASKERPKSLLSEFAWDEAEIARSKEFAALTDEVHTDLHECLGHGSGVLLPSTPSNALGEYSSTLEEARADIFGLYYIADPKLVELGILGSPEAYKAAYDNYIRNGLMTQFTRVELGRPNTESHMQNRKLIAEWCYEKGAPENVIEKKVRGGKTYFVINDYVRLRELFGELLGELQRIKSEGDFAAGKALVEKYAVNIDPELHKEVLERYAGLGLKPYSGFINPSVEPVMDSKGEVVDYKVIYGDDFLSQQMEYGEKYKTL